MYGPTQTPVFLTYTSLFYNPNRSIFNPSTSLFNLNIGIFNINWNILLPKRSIFNPTNGNGTEFPTDFSHSVASSSISTTNWLLLFS